ncbi:receptor-like protein 7 [Macadamia integrifolia]|uniref:receptor-like protein 7 n=1 Tax=Macadamia integrifolia TaxID=60698 RepID=UPI001C4E5293|nr:receptor-like protein 7 [Macadamia integrifolia]
MMKQLLQLLFLFFQSMLTVSFTLDQRKCLGDQSSALLQLKQSFSFSSSSSSSSYCIKLESWNVSTDCCSWEGITCEMDTGDVIELDLSNCCLSGSLHFNSSLFYLANLQRLNLAYNHFNSSPIPSGLARLTSLTHLNLSHSGFSGQIPLEILQLKRLVSLDLSSSNGFSLKIEKFSLTTLAQKLSNLEELLLDHVNISSAVPEILVNLSSLTSLSLMSCGLNGKFPPSIFEIDKLEQLALRDNPGLSGYLPEIHLGNSSLKFLDLSETSFSGKLPNSIGNLKYLNHLSLSGCQFSGLIPVSLASLTQLVHLELSSNQLTGPIPSSISRLTNLAVLNLSSNSFTGTTELAIFQQLKKLNVLDLSNNNLSLITNTTLNSSFPRFQALRLSSCNISEFPNFLRSQEKLLDLDLSNNRIHGQIPTWMWNIGKHLHHLDLSHNMLQGFEQPMVVLPWRNLLSLDLKNNTLEGSLPIPSDSTLFFSASDNKFSGEIPSLICNASSLQYLDLSHNQLSGLIPQCLGNFSKSLLVLKLRGNSLHGPVLHTFTDESRLRMLDLNANKLGGALPRSIANLKKLEVLELGNNRIKDSFPFWLGALPNLQVLVLRTNKFHGPIENPQSGFSFSRLLILDLSENSFTFHLPSKYFWTWKAMMTLDEGKTQLQYNTGHGYYQDSVTLVKKGHEIILVDIITIFKVLDLSNNGFKGEIPEAIGNLKALTVLDLSYNSLTGPIPSTIRNLTKLEKWDLSQNRFQGSLPIPPRYTKFFSISNNDLTGEIPSVICNLSSLQLLDLSGNQMSGSLPECLSSFSKSLTVLKLRGNKFLGTIPQAFTNGSNLKTLDLNANQLGGQVPRSLANCTMLEVLDLGNNQISDTFPSWLENLRNLQVLILRSNRFHGLIEPPSSNSSFSNLHIIDISFNSFTSSFPSKYFQSWKAMMTVDKSYSRRPKYIGSIYYHDSVTVESKGREIVLVKILTIFTAIDLSNNKFQGEIEESIGNLKSLIVLNLSCNSFTGAIPSSLGNLTELESLDLSKNKLSGEIPWQLTRLTFLAVLDLSYNQLEGPIPQGQQFETFTNTSFEGNLELCGPPLSKNCEDTEAAEPATSLTESTTSEFDWKFMLIGYGCGAVVGVVMGHLIVEWKLKWFVRAMGLVNLQGQRRSR